MAITDAGEVFQLLRDGRPRTRSDLATETGLARTSVLVRLTALTKLGLVAAHGTAASSGGRPPTRLAFDPTSHLVIGIDLGATHGAVGIADLTGNILLRERQQLDIAAGASQILTQMLDAATRLLATDHLSNPRILGIGIGVPGPVEHATGRPIRPPIMPGWDGFDIPGFVNERMPVPVLVDNDVNLLALGERAKAWPTVSDLLFIKVSTGIGAGVIAGGRLQRGAMGAAGDLGHVQVPHGINELDLEATASAPALANHIATVSDTTVAAADVADRIRTGDPVAIEAARGAGRAIGEVAAMCVSLLNPSTLVIGGRLGVQVQEIIAGIREVVYRRAIPLATQHLNIVPAQGGIDAGIQGAALMVIEEQLSAAAINRRIAAG